jgi:hypothetical protein
MSTITEYFTSVTKDFETKLPKKAVMREISETLDRKMGDVVNKFLNSLHTSKDHEERVKLLKKADRCSGKYDKSKVIFLDINPYEQMGAIDTWLKEVKIAKKHTFFLSVKDDDYIPAAANKIDGLEATLMHVVLGATRGEKKAPKYKEWAESDPRESREEFMKPLLALEVVRQPNFSCASLLKDEAYRNDIIDYSWRYGSTYACVEDKGQSLNSPKKITSAGLNLCSMLHEKSSDDDLLADEVVINSEVEFRNFCDEKTLDDLDVSVSVGELFRSVHKAFIKKDETDLEKCLENLFISSLGSSSTNNVKKLAADILEANNKNSP